MSEVSKYGKTETEIHLEKRAQCREIIKEIMDFGINEDQKKQIIKLMSLELEDRSLMEGILECIKNDEFNNDNIGIIEAD